MTLNNLVGFQLVKIDDKEIVIGRGKERYTLHLHEDYGDCCGYNDIAVELFVSDFCLERNPVITSVEVITTEGDDDGQKCKITFFGEVNTLAKLETYSSSGSGWCYGACVSIVCDELEIDEVLSQW